MSPDYGKKIGKAFEAIYQLHEDASKLLSDCDSVIGKGKAPLFGSVITKDLSKAVYDPGKWMPYGVFRYYDASIELPGIAEGVLIYFWDEAPKPEEPFLIVGQIKYVLDTEESVASVCNCWDLWYAFVKWIKSRPANEVITGLDAGDGRIEWFKLILVPLFAIQSMEQVAIMMDKVRQTPVLETPSA